MGVISKINVGGTTYDINNVMGASGSSHSKGLVPDPGATQGTTKFLREDGTWQTPSFDSSNDLSANYIESYSGVYANEYITTGMGIVIHGIKAGGDNLLTADGGVVKIDVVRNGIDHRNSDSTYSDYIWYGGHYSFGTMTSITISGFYTPSVQPTGYSYSGNYSNAIYSFSFDSGNTATTLSLPASVIFNDWDYSSLDTNTHYEVNIRYNASTQDYYGVMQKWALS